MGWNVKFNIDDVVVEYDSGDIGVIVSMVDDDIIRVHWKSGPDIGRIKWLHASDLIHIRDHYPL